MKELLLFMHFVMITILNGWTLKYDDFMAEKREIGKILLRGANFWAFLC